jgi:hypothetical protein
MVMNIRKIIKEEIDDFDWVGEKAPNPMGNISQEHLDLIKPEELEWIPKIVGCYGLNDVEFRKVERWNKVPLRLKDDTRVRVNDVLVVDYECISVPISSSNIKIVDPEKYDI